MKFCIYLILVDLSYPTMVHIHATTVIPINLVTSTVAGGRMFGITLADTFT